jgi:cellulose biosynthesis protein BcsQ
LPGKRFSQGLLCCGLALQAQPNYAALLASVDVAGPGFINLRLTQSAKSQVLNTILQKGVKFEESPALNLSVSEYDPTSKSSEQFVKFTDEFLERISLWADSKK